MRCGEVLLGRSACAPSCPSPWRRVGARESEAQFDVCSSSGCPPICFFAFVSMCAEGVVCREVAHLEAARSALLVRRPKHLRLEKLPRFVNVVRMLHEHAQAIRCAFELLAKRLDNGNVHGACIKWYARAGSFIARSVVFDSTHVVHYCATRAMEGDAWSSSFRKRPHHEDACAQHGPGGRSHWAVSQDRTSCVPNVGHGGRSCPRCAVKAHAKARIM